jgi:hypothetical protein
VPVTYLRPCSRNGMHHVATEESCGAQGRTSAPRHGSGPEQPRPLPTLQALAHETKTVHHARGWLPIVHHLLWLLSNGRAVSYGQSSLLFISH